MLDSSNPCTRTETAVPRTNTTSRTTSPAPRLSPARLLAALTALTPALALMLTLTASTPAQAQTPTPTIVNICDRTPAVRNAILAKVSTAMTPVTCDTVTETMLSGITAGSSNQFTLRGLTSLKAGDFMGLTGITHISARHQRITTLPADAFMGLDALTNLNFDSSYINTIEPNAFRGLPRLNNLNLARNQIPTPAAPGMFVGLQRRLGVLTMRNQFHRADADDGKATQTNVDFEIKYSFGLEKIVVTMPAGAPTTIDLDVGVEAVAVGTNSMSYLLYKRQLTPGQTHHVINVNLSSFTNNRALDVTVERGTFTRKGVTFSTSEIATQPTFADICARTDVVKNSLLDLLGYSRDSNSCAGVTSDDLASITTLDLSDSDISALAAGDFAGLTALTNLDLSDNLLSTLPATPFAGLTELTDLDLSSNLLTALPATPFSGLTALTDLNLSDNNLTALPATPFAGLTALTDLNLSDNSIATLPATPFAGLTALTDLDLSGNQFTTLPANTFKGLQSALTDLDLRGQFRNVNGTATIPYLIERLSLSLDANTKVATVTIPAGAPAPLQVNLTLTGHNTATSPTAVTIATGATSGTATLIQAASATLTAALAATAPTVPGAQGLVLRSTPLASICTRTAQVQTALLDATSSISSCAEITDAHLLVIDSLDLSSAATATAITTLAAGDFADLPNLASLDLSGQSLTEAGLPLTTFSPLTALTTLDLSGNQLTAIPAGSIPRFSNLFSDLAILDELNLSGNSLTGLPSGIFTGLDALTTLNLSDNKLMGANVRSGAFSRLPELLDLDLSGNEFRTLPDGIFEGLQKDLASLDVSDQFNDSDDNVPTIANLDVLLTLELGEMRTATGGLIWYPATVTIPTGAPAELTLNLTLTNHDLTSTPPSATSVTIPVGAITGTATLIQASSGTLTAALPATAPTVTGATGLTLLVTPPASGICLRTPQVQTALLAAISGITACGDVTTTHLQAITALDLSSDATALTAISSAPISTLKTGDFDDLTGLNGTLDLSGQNLASLPADIFKDLTMMTTLDLSDNRFTGRNTIPVGTFETLAALTTLDFSGNQVRKDDLDTGFFKGLTTLTTLDLTGQFSGVTGANAPATVNRLDELVVLSFNTTTNTATLSIKACTPVALTATIDLEGATVQTQDVTIAAGACSGTGAALTPMPSGTAIAVSLPAKTYTLPAGLSSLQISNSEVQNICSRSPQVVLAITALLNLSADRCGELDSDLLQLITTLDLSSDFMVTLPSATPPPPGQMPDPNGTKVALQSITALKAGDFNGLTNITSLDLGGQMLTTLPDGIFSGAGLTKLATLDLSDNQLTAVPAHSFTSLPALTTLDLSDNRLTTVPARSFASLPALTTLDLSRNEMPTVPVGLFEGLQKSLTFSDLREQFYNDNNTATIAGFTASLSVNVNPTTFLATVTAGINVPSTTRVRLTGADFADGSPNYVEVDIAAGATSATVQLVQASGEDLTDTLPPQGVRPSGSEGLNLIPTLTGFCDRTPVVETALLAAIAGITDCNNVTAAHLANITTLDLSAATIGALAAGDFAGLSQLTTLNLSTDTMTALPEDIFLGLGEVTTLDLSANQLTSAGLPSDVFAPMGKLDDLDLRDNALTTLSPTMLATIASVTNLDLSDNLLTSAGLPPRIFAPLSQLTDLDLSDNEMTFLTEGIFEGLTVPLLNLDVRNQLGASNDFDELLRLSFDPTSKVATVSLRTGAPEELTVPLTLTNADATSPTAVVIPAGATSGTATLIAATGMTLNAVLGTAPTLTNTMGNALLGLNLLTSASGICGRTPQVQIAILASNKIKIPGSNETCATIDANDLSKLINRFHLSSSADALVAASAAPITALRAGDLDGLTSVEAVRLERQSLTELPANLFSQMTALTTIDLRENNLTASGLPPRIFAGNANLVEIRLSENQIDTLPDDLFDGLSNAITTLQLSDQFKSHPSEPKRNAKMHLSLAQTSNTVTATLPVRAFRAMTVRLAVAGNTGMSSPTTINILRGANSGTQTLVPASPSDTLIANFDFTGEGPLTAASTNGVTGLDIVTNLAGICTRTAAVRDALIAAITPTTDCNLVTADMLNKVTGTLDLSGATLTTLKAGDFADLTALQTLNLSGTNVNLTALPAGIFDDLNSLTTLDLSGNSITALPAGIFNGLRNLTSLDLSDNSIDALPAGIFNGLTKVTTLDLKDNELAPAGVPPRPFGLMASLTSLDLSGNELNSLPNGIFLGVQQPLKFLDLRDQFRNDNDATTTIPGLNVIVRLSLDPMSKIATANIRTGTPVPLTLNLDLSGHAGNSPTSVTIDTGYRSNTVTLLEADGDTLTATLNPTPPDLPAGIHGLTLYTDLPGICGRNAVVQAALIAAATSANHCADVTDDMLANITGTLDLSVASGAVPTISALQAGDFDGLSQINALILSNQGLTALPAGIFSGAGLDDLNNINLSENLLTTADLPPRSFASLPMLTGLDLSGNQLSTPPTGLFSGLTLKLASYDLRGQFNDADDNAPTIDKHYVVLSLTLTGTNATVSIPTGAPEALSVTLDLAGADANTATVPIALGATSGTIALTQAAGQALGASLNATPPTLTVSNTGLTIYNSLPGICGRPAGVQAALIATTAVTVTNCIDVTDNMLGAISGDLDLSSRGITSLQIADLAGIDLTTITGLDLSGNSLTTLEAGVFDGFTTIETLDLSSNQIATLPDGLFTSLATLTSLDLTGNDGAPFPLEVKLSTVAMAVSSTSQSTSQSGPQASAGNPFQLQAIIPTETGTMMQVQVNLPLRMAAAVTVYAQTDTGTIHSITPGTPVPTDAAVNTVQIDNVCFDETPTDATTGDGCTGEDTTSDTTFTGVQLASGFALVLDAFPTFDEQIDDQNYIQEVSITPLQLPQAGLTLPPSGVAPSLTYSLTATITTGDEAQLASELPAGLAFSATTRTLSGAPTALGTYAMTYTVADNNGDTDSLTFNVQVNEVPADLNQLHAQILSHFAITVADSAGQAVSDRIDRMVSGQKPRFSINKDGSDFELPLTAKRSAFTVWGQGNRSDLALTAGDWTWDGDISGEQIGFDWRSANSTFIIGLMTQSLEGLFKYAGNIPDAQHLSGYYRTPMDSDHYYIGWAPRGLNNTSWLNFWAMSGTGTGSVTLGGELGGGLQSDTDMDMSHFGISLVPLNNSRGLRLRLRAESTTASLSMAAAPNLQPLDLEVTRQRILLEPSTADMIRGDQQQLVVSAEIGTRSDSTTINGVTDPNIPGLPTGDGSEYGLKLHYSWRNFDLQMGARQLQLSKTETQERGEYEEEGYYISLTLGSRSDERGWTASLRPTWGNTGSSIDRLWQTGQVSDLALNSGASSSDAAAGTPSGSMEAQLSYGMLAPFGGSGLFIPYSKLHTSDGGATSATVGVNLSLNSGWDLNWQYSDSFSADSSNIGSRSAIGSNDSGEFKLGAKLSF